MKTVIITGVSSGFGYELARLLLTKNKNSGKTFFKVYGISRRTPDEWFKDHVQEKLTKIKNSVRKKKGIIDDEEGDWICHWAKGWYENSRQQWGISGDLFTEKNGFYHKSIDLKKIVRKDTMDYDTLDEFLKQETRFDYIFLNAGRMSETIELMEKTNIDEIKEIMDLNVWSNKILLDICLVDKAIQTVVFSASTAGRKIRKSYNAYNLSKYELNILGELYSLERQDIQFLVFGLCIMTTPLTEYLCQQVRASDKKNVEELWKVIDKIENDKKEKGKKIPDYGSTPEQRARDVLFLLFGVDDLSLYGIKSGQYKEIRKLKLNEHAISKFTEQFLYSSNGA